jgi:formylglycine-generating enzyme required for sulfatase activity
MQVELINASEQHPFEIRSISSAEQFVDEDDLTEWIFYVKPLLPGKHTLLLKIAVIETIRGKERKRELVLEQTIDILTTVPKDEEFSFNAADFKLAFGNDDTVANEKESSGRTGSSISSTLRRTSLVLLALIVFIGGTYAIVPQEVDWLRVRYLLDTKEAYKEYIEKYEGKKDKHIQKAYIRKIAKKSTVKEIIEFEEKFENSPLLPQLETLKEELRVSRLEEIVRTEDVSAIKAFVDSFSQASQEEKKVINRIVAKKDLPEETKRSLSYTITSVDSTALVEDETMPTTSDSQEEEALLQESTITETGGTEMKEPKNSSLTLPKSKEEQAWKTFINRLNADSLKVFIEENPDNQYLSLAQKRLGYLEGKDAWEALGDSPNETELLSFLKKYGDGPYADLAKAKLKALKPEPVEEPIVKEAPKPDRGILEGIERNMVSIPGGTFQMGDVFDDDEYEDEKPVHQVTVKSFSMLAHEVTFEMYDAFCEATDKEKPEDEGWGRGKRPVINVSWYNAVEYCNWLSGTRGYKPVYTINGSTVTINENANGFRLPTEAEWEYAARERGRKVRFGNGKDIADPEEINFNGSESYKESYSIIGKYRGKTTEVGIFAPNNLGLYDMSGNVREWCWDWYSENYYQQSDGANNPKGPNSGEYRVVRGGSWDGNPNYCRATVRFNFYPYNGYDFIGFRIIRHQ